MSGIIQKGARRFTTQIAAAGVPDAVATTIPLISVVGLPTDTTVEIVVDRTDSNGVLTPAKEEVIRGTVSGTNLINCIRGVEGTAQAHSAGATVNQFLTASMWNNVMNYILDTASASNGLIGGKIVPTVASNNLTVAIKTLAGTDPSTSSPVGIWIGDTLRWITGALSYTANAGSNWANAGSAELATKEINYFVYVGYNATDNIFIGWSRIPYANTGADVSGAVANEKVLMSNWTTNKDANSTLVNIGRFAATLSAGAGYTWTVPTFNANNLIQRPIFETRVLDCTATIAPESGSFTNQPTVVYAKYQIIGRNARVQYRFSFGNPSGGTGRTLITVPINGVINRNVILSNFGDNSTASAFLFNNDSKIYLSKYDATTAIGNSVAIDINGEYPI